MIQVRRHVARVHRAWKPDGTRERGGSGADEVVTIGHLLVAFGSSVGDGGRVRACQNTS